MNKLSWLLLIAAACTISTRPTQYAVRTTNFPAKADTRVTIDSAIVALLVKPDSFGYSLAQWNAFGIYFAAPIGALYGKDTVRLAWKCPAGGKTKCPTRQLCPIGKSRTGAGVPARFAVACKNELAALAQPPLTAVQQAVLDTMCLSWSVKDNHVTLATCGGALPMRKRMAFDVDSTGLAVTSAVYPDWYGDTLFRHVTDSIRIANTR